MVNTMEDLREEVASRLRNSLHGREIDMMETVRPRIPHMLGVTPLGKVHDPKNEEMTLLDPQHPFWQSYEDDVRTKNQLSSKVQTAIRSLKEDGVFRMNYPYGEEAEVVYVEVDKLHPTANAMNTSCKECGATVMTQPNLEEELGRYHLKFTIDCPECDFTSSYSQPLFKGGQV